mmetsp:Transcript_49998/g.57729  ORF Transcript_49998/g.57729 Transcript_49998/m.57729 type:complete len:467 (-) Transcript_49998:84-1484(-)
MNQIKHAKMNIYKMRFDWVFALIVLVSLSFPSDAVTRELQQREIGTEICYCAPNSYEFTLDFKLTCPPVNITLGDAIAATTCMVSPFGEPGVIDLVPVSVQSVDILELNQNLQVIVQENVGGDLVDGDTFSYISYAAEPGMIVNPEDLPRAIQVNIVGVNKDGEDIINVYLITFTNSCGAYPVLSEGQFAGWTRFSDLGPPDQEYCPAVPSSLTNPPTSPQTLPPKTPSTLTPTMAPIITPTITTTITPTITPTMAPTTMLSMSMSLDKNFKSLSLRDSFSIQDYLDETVDIMQDRASSEFGRKDQNRNRGTIFRDNNEKKHRLESLSISGGNPNNSDSTDKNGKEKKSVSSAKDGRVPVDMKEDDTESFISAKDDRECDDYPCQSLPTSESKQVKLGESVPKQKDDKSGKNNKSGKNSKSGKNKKSDKSDFETKKEQKGSSKKEKTKLKKAEKDAKNSGKKRLRI